MEQAQSQSGPLVKVLITTLIKFSEKFAGIEVHVSVGGKFIKLNYPNDAFIDILRKLQQKEVEEVYILQNDCKQLVEHAQKSMSAQTFYDPATVDEKRVESMSASFEVVKSVIGQIGVDAETLKLMKTINTRAMSVMSESPSIFVFIKNFKKNCSEEFLLAVLTNYIMALVIDKFPWKSEQVKEKGSLASYMCDMMLGEDDFAQIRKWEDEGGELSEKIKKHPQTTSENLKRTRNLIPSETITIIEQHHELPDGKGFPFGITGTRFNQLSTIFIISQQFTHLLHKHKYDYDKRYDIIVKLKEKYGESKTFEKSLEALMIVVD
jgi:hypothetical protein